MGRKRKLDEEAADTLSKPVAKRPNGGGSVNIVGQLSKDKSLVKEQPTTKKLVTSVLKQSKGDGTKSPKRQVSFTPPVELSTTLKEVAEGKEKNLQGELERILSQFENLRGHSLVLWLQELQSHICALGKQGTSGMEGLVVELFKLKWRDMEPPVVEAHKGFLVNLVSANSCYTRATIKVLLDNFKPLSENPEQDSLLFSHTHDVLKRLLAVSPVGAREELLISISFKFPYLKKPAYTQICYVSALLEMTSYVEQSTGQILSSVLEKMIKLDAHLSRESVLEYYDALEDDEAVDKDQENLITALDLMMRALITYIDQNTLTDGEYDKVKAAPFVEHLLQVFNTHLIPSYNIVHTQYLFFHLAGLSPLILQQFLANLWRTFSNPNTPSILRQTAVAYIASLLSRLSTCSPSLLINYLERMTSWAHLYIRTREDSSTDFMYTDLACHGPFYSACQAIFYLFAFRHKTLMASPARVKVLQSLSWHSLITSPLNPLRVCLPPVVENFNRVARHYQLAYCTAIIERNNRINLPVVGSLSSATRGKPLLLDCFFPFDPYLLEGTKDLFEEKYLEYTPLPAYKEAKESNEVDEETLDDLEISVERPRLESVRSDTSSRSRKDSVGSLSELLLQDLPAALI